MSEGIFVSYRRSDSQSATGRMCDHLRQNGFGSRSDLFLDIDNIPPGADFRHVINETLNQCDIVLVVIGRSWVNARDAQGNRRLDSPSDTHRIEVEAALKSEAIVIPVLVEGAEHPTAADLPPELEALAFRNSWEIADRRFGADVTALAEHIRRRRVRDVEEPPVITKVQPVLDHEQSTAPRAGGILRWLPKNRWKRWALYALVVFAFFAILGAILESTKKSGGTTSPSSATTDAATSTITATTLPGATTLPPTTTQATSTVAPATSAASTGTTGVRLPNRFATSVPGSDCTSEAVQRDTGDWVPLQKCVGPWTIAATGSGEDARVYRWDGSKWVYRGTRSLSCIDNFAELGVSLFDAADFGASTKRTTSCRLEVQLLTEPSTGPLRVGDVGPRVEQLQMRLANLGLLRTAVDDRYGLNTAAAVVDLKLLLGIGTPDTVDGVADEYILGLLG